MREYWNPIYTAWFPQGMETPELALMRVTPEKAEYWDTPSRKLATLANLVKAAAKGEHANVGRNEKLSLR